MKRILIGIGLAVGGLVVVLILALIVFWVWGGSIASRRFDHVQAEPLPIPTGAESIAYGEHLARTTGCMGCHGEDLGGEVLIDNPALGTFAPGNLTSGEGGIPDTMTDADWVRAIRHGIGRDHTALLVMPSQEYYFFNDEELAR